MAKGTGPLLKDGGWTTGRRTPGLQRKVSISLLMFAELGDAGTIEKPRGIMIPTLANLLKMYLKFYILANTLGICYPNTNISHTMALSERLSVLPFAEQFVSHGTYDHVPTSDYPVKL